MNASHRRISIAALMGTSLLAGCSSSRSPSKSWRPTVAGVTVETVHFQPTPEYYEASGTVQSATTSILGAQISGTVRAVYVRPGDHVRRGQVLALLDDRRVRAQLAAANAGIEESRYGMAEVAEALAAAKARTTLAGLTYRRYQALLAKDSVSRAEFDQASADYKAAMANLAALEAKKKQIEAQHRQAQSEAAAAETAFSYSRIVSPIDGVVTAKAVDAGTLAMPGMPLLTVADPTHYRLEASLPEKFFDLARVGEPVAVRLHGAEFRGRVAEVAPAADPASRTFRVKINLPENCGCSAGDYGTAEFPVGRKRLLTVPQEALVARGELEGVFAVGSDGLAEYRLVRTGRRFGDRIEILSGLSDGDRIAASGASRLSDGARLEGR